jgi:hypothetical protein
MLSLVRDSIIFVFSSVIMVDSYCCPKPF